ncbi:hypothetical protein CUMW_148340 [Citrus unshiu]|uniref:RBR-type E3 ubiquitin transferase n=1 Tax=Citrus unshiu TaxID=55188 RepID=A0A2H5PLU5_CITUN|nr:hypothetical protein CUMW_148340 [Citrus unshiu]
MTLFLNNNNKKNEEKKSWEAHCRDQLRTEGDKKKKAMEAASLVKFASNQWQQTRNSRTRISALTLSVQDDNTAKIECPGLDCKHNLDPFACEPVIPASLFSKWCDVLCEDYVLGFERSYCPNTNCMAMVVNECERSGKVKKTQCPNCKQWFCFQCKLKWHAGYRCEESRNLRDQNDIVFGQLVERMKWARCPACGHCVERKDGCSVVMCRLCLKMEKGQECLIGLQDIESTKRVFAKVTWSARLPRIKAKLLIFTNRFREAFMRFLLVG